MSKTVSVNLHYRIKDTGLQYYHMCAMASDSNQTDSEFTYDDFLLIHEYQLKTSCVPEIYWETLFTKLKYEVYDAGVAFQVCQVQIVGEDTEENESDIKLKWKVVVKSDEGIKCDDKKHIYLIDHAWTYRAHEAKMYLKEVPGLKERMAALMDIEEEERDTDEVIEDIVTEMWKYNQTYTVGNFEAGSAERLPVWYIMDEFGSRIQHSDMPSFKMAPLLYGPSQIAFSILWPVMDLENGDEVTRDYVINCHHPERRKALLIPWQPADFTDLPFEQCEPEPSFFSEHIIDESAITDLKEAPSLPTDRKLKVCINYKDFPPLTDERFEMVDTGEEADIIWIHTHFKDFKSLYSEGKIHYINQFPSEQCVTVKDLLAVVCRRAGDGKYDPETLEGSPKWLPVTYNLNTELSKFVSYFQHREAKGLDNVWILKPWNLTCGADICVTDNLDQILRLTETGPRVACKYVSDCVTVYYDKIGANAKVDLRYMVFLASVNPLRLYAYKPCSVRRAQKEYTATNFDDLLIHLTYPDFYEINEFTSIPYFTDDFEKKFEAANPDMKWADVEKSIFEMFVEVFKAASSKPSPAGIANFPLSRAIYGIDLLLEWKKNEKGERYVQPKLEEVNFAPDYATTWAKFYPEISNDGFSALFFDDIDGRENIVRLA